MTKQGAWAHVVYPSREQMTRGDTAEVNAAVTLNLKAPPTQVLHSANAVPAKVVVTCVISARLSASSYDFSLSDTGWIQRSFESMDTARWQWFVGPKVGGMQELVLSLRPVVQVEQSTRNVSPPLTPDNTNIASYLIRARVSVPLAQRIPEIMSSLSADFRVAQGLVEAATALVVAIVGFGAAIGIKRLRRKRREEPPPSGGKPLTAE